MTPADFEAYCRDNPDLRTLRESRKPDATAEPKVTAIEISAIRETIRQRAVKVFAKHEAEWVAIVDLTKRTQKPIGTLVQNFYAQKTRDTEN